MRALVPDQQGSVEIADVEEPIETPGATLIDVRAFSPNRGETFLMSSPLDGWRPGKDVAGVISTAGDTFLSAPGWSLIHPATDGQSVLLFLRLPSRFFPRASPSTSRRPCRSRASRLFAFYKPRVRW